jgi:transposase
VGTLEIGLDFPRGSRFACPETGCPQGACPVHDTTEKRWRHLDFFEHQALLSARVPRVDCATHGVHLVAVPWARPGGGFTLLMEVALLSFAAEMPVAPLARMARVHDTRIWRLLEHHVGVARDKLDFSGVSAIAMDETSARRGQDDVSLFMDLEQRRVMFATEGKDADTVKAFAEDLAAHGGSPATQIETVCADMSPAFQAGIAAHLCEQEPTEEEQAAAPSFAEQDPIEAAAREDGALSRRPAVEPLHQPEIIVDRYHVVAKANEAVDEVRRAEQKTRPELKRSRYVWLKNEANLTAKQRETLTWLNRPSMQLATARAARWRDDFNAFYEHCDPKEAETYLERWCYGAKRSRLEPIKAFVATVEAHWSGIIAWQRSRLSNGLLEKATNSLVQAAKRRARGYRNKQKMITIIYLIAGRLPLPEIHTILRGAHFSSNASDIVTFFSSNGPSPNSVGTGKAASFVSTELIVLYWVVAAAAVGFASSFAS